MDAPAIPEPGGQLTTVHVSLASNRTRDFKGVVVIRFV